RSLAAEGTRWIALSGGPGFSSIAGRLQFRGLPAGQRWDYRAMAVAERASADAPLALWSGAGEGRVREPLLRAHPLLAGGVVNAGPGSPFGRTVVSTSIEGRRWLDRPRLVQCAIATFADTARTSRSIAGD